MITGLLLLPVRAWSLADTLILTGVMLLVSLDIAFVASLEFPDAGPLWPHIVSALGAYAILILGLGFGLWWRRRQT